MRISDWSSDVCSSDLLTEEGHLGPFREFLVVHQRHRLAARHPGQQFARAVAALRREPLDAVTRPRRADLGVDLGVVGQIGSASCRERVGPHVYTPVGAGPLQKTRTTNTPTPTP